MIYFTVILLLLHLFLAFELLDGTLSKSDKPKKKNGRSKSHSDGMVDWTTFSKDILQSHQHIDYRDDKKFPNAVLGYVTPWNNHGYDIAKHVAQKFTHISPVWFQIRRQQDGCVITGLHDLDQGWVADVRKNNSKVKIVPRFLFEHWNSIDYDHLMLLEDEQEKCVTVVVEFLQRNGFDGVVLELWIQAQSALLGRATEQIVHFLLHFSEILHANGKELILVIPPSLGYGDEPNAIFRPQHFEILAPIVDYFSVMTYDYPNRKPGPVAPIGWVRKCLEILTSKDSWSKQKILMGVNFYGYEYESSTSKMDAVVGHRFLEVLRKQKPEVRWSKQAAEHYLELDKGNVIFYPTLDSLEARNLAKELGTGIAIWELGQGLDYFYNLI